MYVCLCHAVTESQLEEAIERGHTSVEALQEDLGVATGCGTCLGFVQERLGTDALAVAGDSALYYAAV